jgi:hypothetical protein
MTGPSEWIKRQMVETNGSSDRECRRVGGIFPPVWVAFSRAGTGHREKDEAFFGPIWRLRVPTGLPPDGSAQAAILHGQFLTP